MVIEEGNKLSARNSTRSHELDAQMVKRWNEAGGEIVTLPAEDQARMRKILAGVGEEVTKGNPQVSAFYKRMHTTAQKY
jgi:TRAP-type C4-dicarboxylate transport system substrate-binding protein